MSINKSNRIKMSTLKNMLDEQSFLAIALSQNVLPRAVRVALIVGTVLAILNHGEKMIPISMTSLDFVKVVLTYFVPYSVSTWSSVGAIRASSVEAG